MGIFPVWGYQLIIAIGLAHLLKLNKPLVIISANISLPPFIPFWIFLSLKCGSLLLNEPIVFDEISLETAKTHGLVYFSGAVCLSIIMSLLSGMFSFIFFSLKFKRNG